MSKSQKRKQELYKKLRVCCIVKETIDTKGWEEILGPLLDKKIKSVCGYKNDDNIYIPGWIDNTKDEELRYWKGYKTALMEIWNDVYNHIGAEERLQKQIQYLVDAEKTTQGDISPMEDTKYA